MTFPQHTLSKDSLVKFEQMLFKIATDLIQE